VQEVNWNLTARRKADKLFTVAPLSKSGIQDHGLAVRDPAISFTKHFAVSFFWLNGTSLPVLAVISLRTAASWICAPKR
jgi:hypothetical protein